MENLDVSSWCGWMPHVRQMAPATDRLHQAVVAKAVTYDGDPRIAAHNAHCFAKRTPMGDLMSKDKRGSPRKIDASVAAIVAYDKEARHLARTINGQGVSLDDTR
jgi:phage terminase large subunit-like protein